MKLKVQFIRSPPLVVPIRPQPTPATSRRAIRKAPGVSIHSVSQKSFLRPQTSIKTKTEVICDTCTINNNKPATAKIT